MTRKLTDAERAKRATEAYLAPRQANGFGSPESLAKTREARTENVKATHEADLDDKIETRKMLKERLDEPIQPSADAVLGTTAEKMRGLSRVEAALRTLDDAMCERTKGGKTTTHALIAARFVINHRFGRPKQAIEVESATEEQLLGQIDRSLQAAAATLGDSIVQAARG